MKTAVLRIHVPLVIRDQLNRLAAQASCLLKRKVTRAALVRAMLYLQWTRLTDELLAALKRDAVKRGRRAKGAS